MKLLGICIHHGFSPETRVFAGLLAHRASHYEPLVAYHCWADQDQGLARFESASQSPTLPMDFGWRPNANGARSITGKALGLAQFYRSLPRLAAAAREFAPDVVYSCQQTWDAVAATYVSRKLGIPQIMHLHYDPKFIHAKNSLQRSAVERLRTCDHVVTVGDFIRDCAVQFGVSPDRVTPIHNTMTIPPPVPSGTRESVRAEFGIAPDAPLIGITGRLMSWKGQSDVIQAFARIADAHPAAHVLIIGEGDYRSDLEAMAALTPHAQRIHFTGWRADVPLLLGALDIFSHPSRGEPFALAVLEASAAGLPVTAYADGGLCEMVQDGVTGLLAPTDDVEALAGCFDRLLASPDLARNMGAAGRKRIAADFRPEDAGTAFGKFVNLLAGAETPSHAVVRLAGDSSVSRPGDPIHRS